MEERRKQREEKQPKRERKVESKERGAKRIDRQIDSERGEEARPQNKIDFKDTAIWEDYPPPRVILGHNPTL